MYCEDKDNIKSSYIGTFQRVIENRVHIITTKKCLLCNNFIKNNESLVKHLLKRHQSAFP